MFGGYGVFCHGKMFGMITAKGTLYLKFNDEIKPLLDKHCSEKHSRMPYWSIPREILKDQTALQKWVQLVL